MLLIHPNVKQSIQKKIDEIAALLFETLQVRDIGLYTGSSGIALFLFYYARYKKSTVIHQKAVEVVDGLFTQIAAMPTPVFTLCSGIAGVGWMLDHLCQQRFIQANPDEILLDIDEYVYAAVLNELHKGHYDFMHGATGMALYLTKRNCRDYIHHFLKALNSIAVWDGDCAKWQSTVKNEYEEEKTVFSVALSHGSSSLALVLGKILEIMPEEEMAWKLLKGAVAYICSQEISVDKYGCYFPSFSIEYQPKLYKTRLGWCYGDLGTALAIWQSGLRLHNKAWTKKGMEVLIHAANRRGLLDNMVRDAGICHGTSGLAMIFNRLFFSTKQMEFKDAADYWGIETLRMAKFEDGLAGYKVFRMEKYGGWKTSNCLLDGIAGIGLCLLSFITEDDPVWDECFLLS
ncbi:MAG: lanthionine synthetase C family protein [Prevotellaceae bacterium]|jgi:lantibiotic modifying enzyme|nr:lanthionine synthetase C family protein [Prevotellaceae bacterium]